MQRLWRTILTTAFLVAAFAAPSYSQSYTLVPFASGQYFTTSGTVTACNGCLLNAYLSGTSTRRDTYSDSSGTANANPVVLSATGRATVYLAVGVSYRLVLTDSTGGTTYWDIDPVQAVPSSAGNLDITATAGEALSLGDCAYLSDGSGSLTAGRWYQCDADNTYESSTAGIVGLATAAIASAGTGTIRISGRMTGLSGLTAGEFYYVSATAGAVTATPPTNQRFIGQADTTTTLDIHGDAGAVKLPDSDGTHTLALITTSNLTADRRITILPGDSNRQITLSGDLNVAAPAVVSQDYSTTGTPKFGTVGIGDSDATHHLSFITTSNLTADRTVSILPGNRSSTLILTGDLTVNSTTTLPQTIQPGLTAVRVYTANDTWTKPASLHSVVVWVVGGGGGGGGSGAANAGETSKANGGGGGGVSMKRVVAASLGATETVTVGAAGTGGTAGVSAGSAGGTSSFGAHLSATGGAGGGGAGSQAPPTFGNATAAGGTGSSGDVNITGESGGRGFSLGSGESSGGNGGSSLFGAGAPRSFGTSAGSAGTVYGGGGSGGDSLTSAAAQAGGNGAAGIVIVYEYSN